jgi:NAD(P)-dependent dehydrogenase (short-subunit alcohol dehydrogenase family)
MMTHRCPSFFNLPCFVTVRFVNCKPPQRPFRRFLFPAHPLLLLADTLQLTPTKMSVDPSFRGKCIVITGAGGNFGRDGCLYFAERGAHVAALDKNNEALEETVRLVKEKASDATIVHFACDVTDVSSVQTAIDECTTALGRIDMLWNNAGYQGQIKPTLEYDPTDFALVMNINVTGMFIVLQAVAKKMVEQGEQDTLYSIVNTSSVAGLRGTPAMVAYASSKAAVLAMTVSTSKDLAPHGIRVNAVSPALIGPGFMWDRQNELHASSGSPYFATDPQVVAQNKISGVPLKRLGSVTEVIQAVAFLLSEQSSYSTGTNLVIDGGMSAGLRC